MSATHTSEMDAEDQKDIINKIKTSGNEGEPTKEPTEEPTEEPIEEPTEEPMDNLEENLFLDEPKKMSIFAPEGSKEDLFNKKMIKLAHNALSRGKGKNHSVNKDEIQAWIDSNLNSHTESNDLRETCWKGYKQIGVKEKNGRKVPNCVPLNESKYKGKEVNESLTILNRNDILNKLKETFNKNSEMEPLTKPVPTKPVPTKPIDPSRKDKPFLPKPNVQPDPKAINKK